jgi:hypothetical protein
MSNDIQIHAKSALNGECKRILSMIELIDSVVQEKKKYIPDSSTSFFLSSDKSFVMVTQLSTDEKTSASLKELQVPLQPECILSVLRAWLSIERYGSFEVLYVGILMTREWLESGVENLVSITTKDLIKEALAEILLVVLGHFTRFPSDISELVRILKTAAMKRVMLVFLRDVNGTSRAFRLNASMTVAEVLNGCIPIVGARFVLYGKVMDPSKTLSSIDLKPETTVHILSRLGHLPFRWTEMDAMQAEFEKTQQKE